MRSRDEMLKFWAESAAQGKIPYNLYYHLMLDIRDLLQIQQESTIGCSKCGLKKKYWKKMFCGDSGEHLK